MLQDTATTPEVATTPTIQAKPGKLLQGTIAGSIAALIGAMLWAAVTVFTGYKLGLIAVAIGYFVAFGVRSVGQGSTSAFAITGATLALLGCVLGQALSLIGFFAQEMQTDYFAALASFDFSLLPGLMQDTASAMDIVFYGIAIYEGWRLSRVQA
ncbi:hypothetical protein [Viridibacterium curvum]|uniref:DUF4190 domain-containing protein n=1 Tax=Viridibacterium curvum TaxID=1101404 RepID=A0ABP9QSN7_9RHOO